METGQVVYIYFEAETNTPYYYNPETTFTTYERTPDMIVYDPNTQEPYVEPAPESSQEAPEEPQEHTEAPQEHAESPRQPPEPDHPDDADDIVDVPEQVREFDEHKINRRDTISERSNSFVPGEDGGAPYLPTELQRDIQKFQVAEYAVQFFREHRSHKFSRKKISLEALTEFSSSGLCEPLLSEIADAKLAKLAMQCFKYILVYTGVDKEKNPASYADKLVNLCYQHPILRDEVMFQLLKQTRENPNPEWLVKTWQLFLIIVTYFPSTKNSETWIKSWFSHNFKNENENVAQLAQFCYIRFAARCAQGKPLETTDIGYVHKIPTEYQTGHRQFGASIYEQIWNQRRSVRKLPFPYIVHHMAEQLLKKGAETKEGIFRLPGNLKKVDEMAEATNIGRDAISSADINDVASLFKKWFRDLPDPVVDMDNVERLRDYAEAKDYVTFANTLPRAHKMTLMYLIGFLQRLEKAESVTLMSAKNLGIVFGPNVVQLIGCNEPGKLHDFAVWANEMMEDLIKRWDTSQIYPLAEHYIRE